MPLLSWIPLLACTAPEAPVEVPEGTSAAEPGSPPPLDDPERAVGATVVDIDDVTTRWQPAEGWVIFSARLLSDFDGDGYAEFMVSIGQGTESRDVLVKGPARRSVTLPGDEYASFDGSDGVDYDDRYGDFDGDGEQDLLFGSWVGNYVVFGPFAGAVDVPSRGVALSATPVDVNGDGVMDFVHTPEVGPDDRVEVTWGPISRFGTVPPDFVVNPTCGDDDETWSAYSSEVVVYPDVTGDGVRELRVVGSAFECPDWTLPAGSGTVDPASSGAFMDVPSFQVIADQNADGLPDAVRTVSDSDPRTGLMSTTHTLLESPLQFADGAVIGASEATFAADLLFVGGARFDLTGDGVAEVVATDGDVQDVMVTPDAEMKDTEYALVVLEGGAMLTQPQVYDTLYDVGTGSAFASGVEDGTAFVLVRFTQLTGHPTGEIVVLDLGPATPVDL